MAAGVALVLVHRLHEQDLFVRVIRVRRWWINLPRVHLFAAIDSLAALDGDRIWFPAVVAATVVRRNSRRGQGRRYS